MSTGTVEKSGTLTTTLVKVGGSSTRLVNSFFGNTANTATTYVQFFDVAETTDVTLGTTAPTFSWPLPAESSERGPWPHFFKKGIVIAATTTRTGSSAPSTAIDYNLSLG